MMAEPPVKTGLNLTFRQVLIPGFSPSSHLGTGMLLIGTVPTLGLYPPKSHISDKTVDLCATSMLNTILPFCTVCTPKGA